MYRSTVKVADHTIGFNLQTSHLQEWVEKRFRKVEMALGAECDLEITVNDFYGTMYDDGPTEIEETEEAIIYTRADYKLCVKHDYSRAVLHVYDQLAIKHGIINWYSAWLVHRRKGLLIHSSCIVEHGKAWLFAGHSGAGKSTVAELSIPRPVLSDEATLLLFDDDGSAIVHDSPLRSDLEEPCEVLASPLGGIHFLNQSEQVFRISVSKVDTLVLLMDKVFYWKHNRLETAKLIALCKQVAESVPAFQLHFQKNDTFWGQIS
ncbi:hypothetical protein [Paenibacillus sp. MMS18-CY102]|uniref:hypothetical protein n=1 Tax=Paenibacillus sp. MMS18-CY102 TaxID=2682849 RepID=UPI0013660444|nr:hypothetical protein [Paenibacillus sp. MMS18-CY102]MWC30417.1 hypothetical protein [Paenibacillus sp. MMS18-CY102]